ncbi:hypothetical protein [Synechococcus sp. PCC 7336]|uniref:hypothetical protein n=1 Tax=Synechococcus sp. PCC 7336 TaxID=195250 RepID=UPI000378ABE3|nr:hypothetical protein [Synechococcus sp. PCC 7336]
MIKISKAYLQKLDELKSGEFSRAIVDLSPKSQNQPARRMDREERLRLADETRQLAESALPEIDKQLSRNQGRRLSEVPNNLGLIVVEGPASAIIALSEIEQVKAILEDQLVVSNQGTTMKQFRKAVGTQLKVLK